jgi:MFS family permease
MRHAAALSFYSAGLNFGLLLGFFGGGWIAQTYGWRPAFLAAGAPGLLLAIIVLLTVREPVRGAAERLSDSGAAPPFDGVVKRLWSLRSLRWLAVGTDLNAFGGYANVAFLPLFFYTSHHMSEAGIGLTLAMLTDIPGALGTFLASVIADRFGRRDTRAPVLVPMIGRVDRDSVRAGGVALSEHGRGDCRGRGTGADGRDLCGAGSCRHAKHGAAAHAGDSRGAVPVYLEHHRTGARARHRRTAERRSASLARRRFAALGTGA